MLHNYTVTPYDGACRRRVRWYTVHRRRLSAQLSSRLRYTPLLGVAVGHAGVAPGWPPGSTRPLHARAPVDSLRASGRRGLGIQRQWAASVRAQPPSSRAGGGGERPATCGSAARGNARECALEGQGALPPTQVGGGRPRRLPARGLPRPRHGGEGTPRPRPSGCKPNVHQLQSHVYVCR